MKQTCKICGCTDTDPCYHPKLGLCWWVADDLCSHCQKELTGEIPASSVTHCVNSSNEVEFSSNPSDEKKNNYLFEFELDAVYISAIGTTKAEARRKAEAKLNRKKPSSYLRRSWPDNKRKINLLDEHEI